MFYSEIENLYLTVFMHIYAFLCICVILAFRWDGHIHRKIKAWQFMQRLRKIRITGRFTSFYVLVVSEKISSGRCQDNSA